MTIPKPQYSAQTLAWPIRFGQAGYAGLRTSNGVPQLAIPAMLYKQVFTAPLAAVTNGFSASHLGQVAVGSINMTLGGSLTAGGVGTNATPRNVVITVTHASAVVALSGVVSGTNQYGKPITETWSVTAGTTSKTYTGAKAFATVTSITEVNAADASGDTVIAGSGVLLGLAFRAPLTKPLFEQQDAAILTTGTFVAGTGLNAVTDYRGTYAPAAAPNGVIVWTIYYIVDDPTDINGA